MGKGVPSANRGWVVTTAGFPQGQRYATPTMPLGGRCSCVVTVSSSAAVIGSSTALSSQLTEPPPNHERAAHKATRRTRTALRSNYRHAALGGTTRRNYREVRLTNAEWAASCERRPQRRILDVRAAGLQEEDDGTTLFRSVSSDEDGGDPANIAASGASNQTQRDARAAHRKGATPTWMIAAVSP